MRDEATLRVFRMRWWTPDPHPCLGGCGTILQHPWAKRCPKCNRAHVREKENVRYWELAEKGICVECGKVPAVQGGRLCKVHRERHRESVRKSKAKKRWRDRKFVDCEICGIKIKKISQTKYCRPCSVDRNGAWHLRRRFARLKERGLCTDCGRVPAREDRVYCEECSVKQVGARRRLYNERKREGLCIQCGKKPRGKTTLRCEECRRDRKLKEIRQQLRKEDG